MTSDAREDDDARDLLPEALRDDWAAVPRSILYQLFVVGALVGAGTALSITGWILGVPALRWGFPVALLVAWLQNRLPWDRAALAQLHAVRHRPTA